MRKKNNNHKNDKRSAARKKEQDKAMFDDWLQNNDSVPDKDCVVRGSENKPFYNLKKNETLKKHKNAEHKEVSRSKQDIEDSSNQITKDTKDVFCEDTHLFRQWVGENLETPNKDANFLKEEDLRYKQPFSKEGNKLKNSIKPQYKNYDKFYVEKNDMMEDWLKRNDIFDKDQKIKDEEIYMYPPSLTDRIRIDSSIDLHRLKVDEALLQLKIYIKECFDNNEKVVLIIHGKGIHSRGGPKIRGAVYKWIEREGKSYIRFHKVASEKLGGTGALVVWLK